MKQTNDIKHLIEALLSQCGITDHTVQIDEEELLGIPVFSIQTAHGRTLIGTRGETLSAFTHVVRKLLEKTEAKGTETSRGPRFVIDVNGYQKKRIDEIKERTQVYADRARHLQSYAELEPMSGYERLIVHTVLANETDLRTESAGSGKERKVIIHYVNND